MEATSHSATIVPDPELQGYERPYHWFMPRESLWARIHDVYVARAIELVVASGAKRVLEVGCGDGWNCGQLKKAGVEAVGVDWSSRGVALARCLVPGGSFVVGDLRDPGVRSELRPPFDALLMVEVIEHVPPADCADALRTLSGYLRPGGVLVLTTPSVNWPNTNPRHFRHFSPESLRAMATESGAFTVESVEGYGDIHVTRSFTRAQRAIDNRLVRLKPVVSRLLDRAEKRSRATDPSVSMGLIAVFRAVGGNGSKERA